MKEFHFPFATESAEELVNHPGLDAVVVASLHTLHYEHARLALRAAHGLAVDRGRIVREAMAVVLADLEAKGADSILVRRLRHR